MKGGNGANETSAVTLRRAGVRKLPEKLTRSRGAAEEVRKLMKGGNEANEMSAVTLRRAGVRKLPEKAHAETRRNERW